MVALRRAAATDAAAAAAADDDDDYDAMRDDAGYMDHVDQMSIKISR